MRLRASLAALLYLALSGCSTAGPTTSGLSQQAVTTLGKLSYLAPTYYRPRTRPFVHDERWVLMRGPSLASDKAVLYRISREEFQNINLGDFCGTRFFCSVSLSTDGDVADLYCRITGKEHPTLKGELSPKYKAFLEGKGR